MGVVIVFDFDKTIIECDSDDWVVENFGLTQLFSALLPTMPNNSLMDRMMEELHLQGKTAQDITDCLRKIPLSLNIISAIHSAYASGCDLRIASDANMFFVETVLRHHGILHCFSEINTNSALVNEDGKLQILPYHEYRSSSHGCNLCPPNLCKGLVIEGIRASSTEKRFIYVGDGKNDYCPSLKLTPEDCVMPRKNFELWNSILTNPTLIKAGVQEWKNGEELEIALTNFIRRNCENYKDSQKNRFFEEFLVSDCKSQTSPIAPPGSIKKAVQVPH